MKPSDMPLNVKIASAKSELRHLANTLCVKYELPGAVFDLILESLLADERGENLALTATQFIDFVETEGERNGDTE